MDRTAEHFPASSRILSKAEMRRVAQQLADAHPIIQCEPKRRGRGRAKKSLDMIQVIYEIAKAAQPITGRGIGYKLFVKGRIPDMGKKSMAIVYRLLKEAREEGTVPWEWIVEQSRKLDRGLSFVNPTHFKDFMRESYRRDFWNHQPMRIEVWSEKGTVQGVLEPILEKYNVGFRNVKGFNSATSMWEVAQDDDGRPLIVLYVGDWDPSGMCMSEVDIPNRLARYNGSHVSVTRIALREPDLAPLPSFPASAKEDDPRYEWFYSNYGDRCWELDAMDPNDLRDCVEDEIKELIEPGAWARCEHMQKEEVATLRSTLDLWDGKAKAALSLRELAAARNKHKPKRKKKATARAVRTRVPNFPKEITKREFTSAKRKTR